MLDQTGITELPPAVALLKHLRYLDVSHNPISTLPDSLGELYQLQTLIIHCCRNMVKLPKVVNKLVNLRNISTTVPMFAWKGLRQLTNLQNLPCLSLDDEEDGWTIDELGDLHELRDEIHILGIECVKDKEESKKGGLAGKANVTKLNLFWADPEGRKNTNRGDCDEYVLEGLEPHPNITSIEVHNFNGVRFPTWLMGMAVLTNGGSCRTPLKNLTKVKLLNCTRCQTLPKLGQLPLLKSLILSGLYVEFIGIEFYGGDDLDMPEAVSFQCLRELDVSGFLRLTTWREPPKASFPHLETLRITDCTLLESVPVLGVTSLTSLELRNLNNVKSLDIIKYSLGLTSLIMNMLPKIEILPKELADNQKLQKLHISDFHKLESMPSGLESLVSLKSKVVNLRDISDTAPMLTWKESQKLTNLQSLPLLSLDDDDGCTTNELEDLHPLSDKIPILGPGCAKADEQIGKSLEYAEDMKQSGNSLECVKDMSLVGSSLESAQGKDLTGKIHEDVVDELTGQFFECVVGKEPSLECVQDNKIMGKSLAYVKDKNIAGSCFERVKEEKLAGKSLEGVDDTELTENSREHVKDSKLVGRSLEGVKAKEIIGKSLEGVEDKERARKDHEVVEDEEYGIALWTRVNNSWVNGSGLQQLINLGEFKDKLHISGLEYVEDKEKARKVGLAGKANVTVLNLVWRKGKRETSSGVFDGDVLEALEPHPNMTSLEVHNFLGVKFPPWIMDMVKWRRLENLTEVRLQNCSRCQTLPTLGHLPLLSSLFLSGFDVEIIGTEFYGYYDLDLPETLSANSVRDTVSMVTQAGQWVSQGGSFRSLLKLDISGFCRLTTWNEPPQAAFPCLETLEIRDCSRMESVPTLSCKTLKLLRLENLDRVRSLDIIKLNRDLTSLFVNGLANLESLPDELSYCMKLQVLFVCGAHKLSRMPNGLKFLVNLISITVWNCQVINFVMGDVLCARSSLRSFKICRCPMLIEIPSGLQECTSLRYLTLETRLMSEGSPINISKFQRLSTLDILCSSAEHLRSVLESAKDHQNLKQVHVEGFKNEVEINAYFSDITPLLHLPLLKFLTLSGYPTIKALPQQLGLLTRITYLRIEQFEDLEEIPTWICELSSLRCLVIADCRNLKYLPSKEDMKHLNLLEILGCPLLTERYETGGPEWQNISHVKDIVVDSVVIQTHWIIIPPNVQSRKCCR